MRVSALSNCQMLQRSEIRHCVENGLQSTVLERHL